MTLVAVAKKHLVLLFIISFTLVSCNKKQSQSKSDAFKFNLPFPIHNADPQLTRGTAANYLLFNLHRGLYYYNPQNELTPWGAKKCTWISEFKIECDIAKKYWSDGSLITATHYLNSFKTIFKSKNRQLEYLKNIRGFDDYLNDSAKELGIYIQNERKLIFEFKKRDPSFISKLSHQVFSPRKEELHYQDSNKILFSGPYKMSEISLSRIRMINNIKYDNHPRPAIEAVFVDESQAALNMYEAQKIDFLRFLPTHEILNPKYSKQIFKSFLSRLDGIVLSKKHIKDINFRKALTHSLDFKVLKKIFSSESDPGCPPLPNEYFFNEEPPCYRFDLKLAKESLKKANLNQLKSTLTIYVPKIESNDHQKMAEWAQESWRENLGIKVNIEQLESKVLLNFAKKQKIEIYRKGYNLQRLGCFQALENFKSQSASNFLNFKSLIFDKELDSLKPSELSSKNCSKLFSQILQQYLWIPTGRFYFAHLHSKKYTGYTINHLNQFDLSKLQLRKRTF